MITGVGTIRVPKLATKPLVSANGVQVDLRTGDYSTAVLDEQGKAWLVAEYAGDKNATAFSPTSSSRLYIHHEMCHIQGMTAND